MGASTVETLYGVGAHVTFGDIYKKTCWDLIAEIKRKYPSSGGSLQFVLVDVRKYEDNLALFHAAFQKNGRVDHAFSIAGVTEGENWFHSSLDIETIKTPPSTSVLDINLLGALYFTRIAAVYLRLGKKADRSENKSIVLFGSLASFKEQAGLFVYSSSKHGVLGLFRSTRKFLHATHGIRVNIVCPGLINTGMSSRVQHIWDERGLPVNNAEQVAQYALTMAAGKQNPDKTDVTGLAVYVEGGKGWEFEQDLDMLDSQWMGEEMSQNLVGIQEALGVGAGWTTNKL